MLRQTARDELALHPAPAPSMAYSTTERVGHSDIVKKPSMTKEQRDQRSRQMNPQFKRAKPNQNSSYGELAPNAQVATTAKVFYEQMLKDDECRGRCNDRTVLKFEFEVGRTCDASNVRTVLCVFGTLLCWGQDDRIVAVLVDS